jgi:hypothetical protein
MIFLCEKPMQKAFAKANKIPKLLKILNMLLKQKLSSIFSNLGIFVGFAIVFHLNNHWPKPTKIPKLLTILNTPLKEKRKKKYP